MISDPTVHSSRLKNLAFKLVLAGCGLAASLGILELAIRAVVPEAAWTITDAAEDWAAHERLGWVQKSDYVSVSKRASGTVVKFETNADGLQPTTARRERTPGLARILIIGDSAVVGRSVPDDQRLHVRLQALLANAGCPAEVLNAGVEGYSTDQELIRLEMLLPAYRPDLIILCVCANDFVSNTRSENSGLSKPRFTLQPDGSLAEQPPAYNARLAAMGKPRLAWLRRSALFGLLRPKLASLRARFGSWEKRNLLGLSDGIYYDGETLGRIDWKLFGAMVVKMNSLSRANGAGFMFYAFPDALEVWDPWIEERKKALGVQDGQYDRFALEKRLQELARETGVKFVKMIEPFSGRQDRGPFHLIPVDRHSNGAGYQLTAEVLSREVGDVLKNRTKAVP